MAEVKRRRRKPKPLEEAIQFSLLKKDKEGLDGRFINDSKGRGVFSCTEFDKGDFLLEYRGDLISKEECERRQRVYHDALKVFLFEFRYDGKLLCVDAARDDASLGRLVNDDHINPNSKMKTIRVDGKPHLCLFAIRSICAGEEITYNYGDSEWPWRCTITAEKNQLRPKQDKATQLRPKQDTTLSEVEPHPLKVYTHFQSEAIDVQKLTVVSDQSGLMESRVCASTEGLEQVTPEKDRISLEGQDCVEKDVEMMPPVKELNEEQSFCGPTEGVKETLSEVEPHPLKVYTHFQSEAIDVQKLTVVSDQSGLMESRVCASTEGLEQVTPEKDRISLEGQDCVEKDVEMMPPVKELNEEQSFCGPTEGVKETLSEVEPHPLKVYTHFQSEAIDVQKLTVVSDQSGLMESRVCASTEGLEQVTPEKDRISLEGQDCVEKDVEMMPPVKELNEEQSFCGPTEGVKESNLSCLSLNRMNQNAFDIVFCAIA
ncbi:hypothetical protein PO909_016183 [Leuciscus waleckii]